MTFAEPFIPKPDELHRLPVLDQNALGHIMDVEDGEIELLEELLGMFEHDQPPRLDALREAIDSDDLVTIKEIAHAIRGSAGTMGASRLRVVAAMLEAYGQGRPMDESPKHLFELLVGAYHEAKLALGESLEKHRKEAEGRG